VFSGSTHEKCEVFLQCKLYRETLRSGGGDRQLCTLSTSSTRTRSGILSVSSLQGEFELIIFSILVTLRVRIIVVIL